MKSILLASDLTPRVDRAFDRAAQLASVKGNKLAIVHVVDGDLLPDSYLKKSLSEAKEALGRQVDQAAFPASLEVSPEVLTGKPHKAIVARARSGNCDMIVLGVPHGDSLVGLFLGTTADRVVRDSHCPVLLVKNRPRKPYQHVLVGTDLSAPSRRALDFALRAFPAVRVTVVHASDVAVAAASTKSGKRQSSDERTEQVRDMVVARLAQLSADKIPPPVEIDTIVEHGTAAEVVSRQVKRLNPDIVVIGTRGQSGASNVLLGSVAETLMQILPCDVLVVRP